jgi:hypothetical protein
MRSAMRCLSLMLLLGQGPPKESWSYRSFTSDFERVADSTSGLPMAERVKGVPLHFRQTLPRSVTPMLNSHDSMDESKKR